jgi:hypothetical protein
VWPGKNKKPGTPARGQLRTAHGLFDEIGMEAFAERARRELLATGETARKRTARLVAEPSQELTALAPAVIMPLASPLMAWHQCPARIAHRDDFDHQFGVALWVSAGRTSPGQAW